MSSRKVQEFSEAFELAAEIPFRPEWANGTGYFDRAVRGSAAPHLEPGQLARCVSPENRRLLLIGTPIGNIVVFDRYTANEGGIFVANMPRAVEHLLLQSNSIDDDGMVRLLGVIPSDNIGFRLRTLAAEIAELVETA